MVNRLSRFLGKWIRHCGWHPEYVTRLFDRNRAHFNDKPVHESILAEGNPDLLFPPRAMRLPRGKKGGRQKVMLPYGFRDDLLDTTPPEAEEAGDGG